jgi:hypothetical protein
MEISESLLEDLKRDTRISIISIDTTLDKDIYHVNYIGKFYSKNAPFHIPVNI